MCPVSAQRMSTSAAGQERAAIEQARKSLGRCLSSPTFQHGEQPEHGGGLLDRDLCCRCSSERASGARQSGTWSVLWRGSGGELEGFCEAYVFELNGRGPGGEEVVIVERAAEASVGRAARGHANAHSGVERQLRLTRYGAYLISEVSGL
jgi:hypothetical protein